MKIWSSEHVFEHPWPTVAHAVWRKYPNPLKPEVTALDTLDRKVGEDGVLRSNRVIETVWSIPDWATKLIGLTNPSYSHEYSEVRPAEQSMTLKTVNLNCTNFVSIDETLKYKPHPEDPDKTLLEQSAAISVRGVPLISYFESFLSGIMSNNAQKGRQALENVIRNVKREYEEMSQKLSSEYEELSSSVRHSMEGLSEAARHGMDEIRREFEDVAAAAGPSRSRQNSLSSSPKRS